MYHKGEVWFVEFPYEENPNQTSNRPVIVLDEDTLGVLSVKVTKHSPRRTDNYDAPILHWEAAGFKFCSTARISKVTRLKPDDFIFKIGVLHPDDVQTVETLYVQFLKDQRNK